MTFAISVTGAYEVKAGSATSPRLGNLSMTVNFFPCYATHRGEVAGLRMVNWRRWQSTLNDPAVPVRNAWASCAGRGKRRLTRACTLSEAKGANCVFWVLTFHTGQGPFRGADSSRAALWGMQKRFGQKAQIACFGGRRGQAEIQENEPCYSETKAELYRVEPAEDAGPKAPVRTMRGDLPGDYQAPLDVF